MGWITNLFGKEKPRTVSSGRLKTGNPNDPDSRESRRDASPDWSQEPGPIIPPLPKTSSATAVIIPPAAPIHNFSQEGWLDRNALASIKETAHEDDLIRQIRGIFPDLSPEEAPFRYYLSKMIHFGDYPLPPLPTSSSRILEFSRRPDTHIGEYTNVVQADPSLIKAVLQMANSAYYAASTQCTSLSQAIIRIGLKGIERIAMAQVVSSRVFKVRGHEDLLKALTLHSIASALGSQHAAYALGTSQGESFLMGLFHDCGKLVLLNLVADIQRRLKRTATPQLIGAAFDSFHTMVGANACRVWALSEAITKSAGEHHAITVDSDITEWCVSIGNHLAYLANAGDPYVTLAPDNPVIQAAGLKETELQALAEKIKDELEGYRNLLE